MNSDNPRQEVKVTDIRMPFGSMVLFMVKWAIASIPALIILVVVGVVFWSTAAALLVSLVTPFGRAPSVVPPRTSSSTGVTGNSSNGSSQLSSEQAAYLSKVLVRNVSVSKSVLGETGVFGEVKNTGDRTLKEVEITIYCLGLNGNPVFEKTYHPVLVTEMPFYGENQPLKPSYSKQFGVKLDDAPSDWTKKVDVKVTNVEFQ